MPKRLSKELNLKAEKETKTKEIILKREVEREKIQKSAKEGHGKAKEEFKAFLTPEQFQKFENREVEMKKKREERRMESPPPAPEGK